MMQSSTVDGEQLQQQPSNHDGSKLASDQQQENIVGNNSTCQQQQTKENLYSDQQNIDAECEKLLRNTKKQVKQMMEEAVTKKFIHEESSSIISLCVAVDACLSHGLKRRALGLFKTSSSTALIQKVSKNCKSAQEVLNTVEDEERKALNDAKSTSGSGNQQQQVERQNLSTTSGLLNNGNKNQNNNRSPVKQLVVASNINVHKRNKWIKVALIDKKLVSIVDHLAENALKYYEPDALMANCLCAQILSSLLVGPSALEFSRSKTNDHYQFDDPTADELLKRHKLANPIACLCTSGNSRQVQQQKFENSSQNLGKNHLHNQNKLSRSATDNISYSKEKRSQCRQTNSYNLTPSKGYKVDKIKMHASDDSTLSKHSADNQQISRISGLRRSPSPNRQQVIKTVRNEGRRRPLALKTNAKRGTLVTDCHHYSCQEISEHHQTRGYSFLCSSSSTGGSIQAGNLSSSANNTMTGCNNHQHQDWSPRMLHETLHQNPRSNLIYAKNNVLLETQPNETMAGYLSLHQTNSDLILKWIPNQMINGSQQTTTCNSSSQGEAKSTGSATSSDKDESSTGNGTLIAEDSGTVNAINEQQQQPMAVESSYLDLVVSLSVSRIVLLHCQFEKYNFKMLAEQECQDELAKSTDVKNQPGTGSSGGRPEVDQPPMRRGQNQGEETLILVEADGIQRAPFKFPKGGLRVFLSCLESGLRPDKYLDPAIKFDDGSSSMMDPLQLSPLLLCDSSISPRTPLSARQNGALDSPSSLNSNGEQQLSRLDSLLKRLPSLKRNRANNDNPVPKVGTTTTEFSGGESPEKQVKNSGEENLNSLPLTTDNYVYRIVSIQQPDWPLPTPPHSALSVGGGSSSSSSPMTANNQQPAFKQQVSNNNNNTQQKFRWSLSRLARFSTKYTNSGSTSSSSIQNSTINFNGDGSLSSLSYSQHQATIEGFNSISDTTTTDSLVQDHQSSNQGDNSTLIQRRDNSSELAKIEAKLDDLKKSTSEEILALRTQSVQTLCESMRKQIVARAFYGWWAYCRKVRIVRAHLVKLIHDDNKCCLVDDDFDDDDDENENSMFLMADLAAGLTRERWNYLIRNERQLDEDQLRMEVNQFVYYGGVENNELRKEVWPYLLGHYEFTYDNSKKMAKDKSSRESYEAFGRDWIKIERVVKQRDDELLAANMAKASAMSRIKDKNTGSGTGRTISETSDEISTLTDNKPADNNNNNNNSDNITESHNENDDSVDEQHDDNNNTNEESSINSTQEPNEELRKKNLRTRKCKDIKVVAKRRRRRPRLESTGSVGSDASLTDQYGNNIHRIDKDVQRCDRNFWYFKDTKNLDKLRNIMCTYVWKHLDIGYVQGMCDLAAPFLVIFDDEIMAYNCFSQLMKRMESNFPHGCAMDQHFESLKHLIQILDPKLFDILQSNGDYTHFYFCYRWLLLDFKRELAYEDVYKVWETIWSARVVVTDHFVVFMALAMVRYYRDIIIENNMDFTDTIKFFNEMAERHNAKGITALARDCIVELRCLIKTMEL